jgi:hypothetical protein
MSKEHQNELLSIILGAITSVSVGTFLLHALSAFLLALIGAFGGWVFQHFIRPKLESWKKIKPKA